jgi:SOS-response transcriptional repressor LexA
MSAISLSFSVTGYRPPIRQALAAKSLTRRQQQVLEFMREFFAENDQLPPTKVISDHFGWKSANSAQLHIEQLVRLRRLEANAVGKLRFVREP